MFPPIDRFIGYWLMSIMLPVLALLAVCVLLLVLAVPLWASAKVAALIRRGIRREGL